MVCIIILIWNRIKNLLYFQGDVTPHKSMPGMYFIHIMNAQFVVNSCIELYTVQIQLIYRGMLDDSKLC